ncbi:MAG TPA: protein tyrosine phosphatase family protein [Candidatus Limnocylindria bacterium]|jgi:protein tyrosine phosphatase (PTP) superfamily phosphohydrolase (DUF442 family)|nr:protein tyrosine phosphatase family protein [Candidatus Limnocylindria bacterium]
MGEKLNEIRAFRMVDGRWGTSGQPLPIQFPILKDAGFEVVINLALPTSDGAIAEEGSLVSGNGMAYVHLPVDFKNPRAADFQAFQRVMDAFGEQKVFVHCIANFRVSAFIYLYRVLRLGASQSQAGEDLRAIWEPDELWSRWMESMLSSAGRKV